MPRKLDTFCPFRYIKWNSDYRNRLAKDTFWRLMDRSYSTSGGLHEWGVQRHWEWTFEIVPLFGQIGREWGCNVQYERTHSRLARWKKWPSGFDGDTRRHDVDWYTTPTATRPFLHIEYENQPLRDSDLIDKLWDSTATNLIVGYGFPISVEAINEIHQYIDGKMVKSLGNKVLLMIYDCAYFNGYILGLTYSSRGWRGTNLIAKRIVDSRGFYRISRVLRGKRAQSLIRNKLGWEPEKG